METLNAPDMDFKDISQAIRALGRFIEPCKLFMKPNEVVDVRKLLIKKTLSVLLEYGMDKKQRKMSRC
jgi:hypothetical protein